MLSSVLYLRLRTLVSLILAFYITYIMASTSGRANPSRNQEIQSFLGKSLSANKKPSALDNNILTSNLGTTLPPLNKDRYHLAAQQL